MRCLVLFFVLACSGTSSSTEYVHESQGGRPHGGDEITAVDPVPARAAESTRQEEATASTERADEDLVVFLAVRSETPSNQAALIEALRSENFYATAHGTNEVVLIVPEERFVEYFHARIGTSTTGANASNRIITERTLEHYRVPRALRRLVESVYFDYQRS